MNIIQKLFSKNKNNDKQSQCQQIQSTEQNNVQTKNSVLFFTFFLPFQGFHTISYDIIQVKRKDDSIKCIAKIQSESKEIIDRRNLKIDFIKDVVIFSFNQLNKLNFLYNDEKNVETAKKITQIPFNLFPSGCFVVTLDQPFDVKTMKVLLEQEINYRFECYSHSFFK